MKFNLNFRIHLSEDPGLKLPQNLQSLLHTAKNMQLIFQIIWAVCVLALHLCLA